MTGGDRAKLYINGDCVGDVTVHGRDASWSHGEFHPGTAFEKYAPLFEKWSHLIHADGAYEPLSPEASSELRRIECETDRLRAKLHFEAADMWVKCLQLNIDGRSIEWKSH